MMARPVRTGPRLTKKARERKHEAEKADKALGGATMKEVEGEEATKKTPHWYVELQWFRLLRGQARLNQIARLLVELAPNKVFDPREIYSSHLKDEAVHQIQDGVQDGDNEDNNEGESGATKKSADKAKPKKLSKAEQIRLQNTLKRQKEAAAKDAEKLRTLGTQAGAKIKLKTESGKLLLLLGMLKQAVRDNQVVDVLDTMWEIEEVSKEVDEKERKAAFKPYADVIRQASEIRNSREALGGVNIYDFQLTAMSDRLPPLNLHSLSGKFKLDDWQLHVIDLINRRKSVLITAPTSSGKTVLSTYVCTTGLKVLFTVPSEPLAWQVAAMLRALKVDVAILVPTLTYVPLKWTVVVGTPHSLESGLTKQVGFDFDYMVGDEIHSLNNQDGPALQRIIRAIPKTCKVLALSATIGNAGELRNWWETIVGENEIELVVHKSRFINLQRYVWAQDFSGNEKTIEDGQENISETGGKLQLLHPASVLTVEYLASDEYASSDLAFTPVDAYALFKAMDALSSSSSVNVDDLKPKSFFAKNGAQRVTLMQAKEYEDALKERLVQIAKEEPDMCRLLLASLAPGSSLKAIKKTRKPLLSQPKEELNRHDRETAAQLMGRVEGALESSSVNTSNAALTDLMFDLYKSERAPAICFQLDSVRCQSMFDGMLRELEERELRKHPNYRRDLERKAKGLEKLREKAAKKGGKRGGEEDEAAEAQEFGETVNEAVDINAPHSEFVLTPPGRGMSAVETRDVEDKLRDDLPPSGDLPHPLIRGLRRGIGMYIEGLSSAYQRLVQSMAQQGRLGVVFSDELLAYGVNMPFRSAVFFGDPGPEWLTPLLHQQMAGRAGRRGLDRQGNLIYCGFAPSRLKSLLRGRLPRVTGRWPLYPTIPLQLEMNKRYEVAGAPLTDEKMHDICSTPLAEWLEKKTVDNYYGVAEDWIKQLGILEHPPSSYNYLIPELVWELRKFLPESLALEYLLEPMVKKYRDMVYNQFDKDADVAHQTSMFLLFCRICAREPYKELTEAELAASGADEATADALKWVRPLPFPHGQDEEWDRWTEIINESQHRITNSDLPYKEQMLLPVPLDQPLDNMVYASFVRNQIDPALPTPVQHHLRERIWIVGEVLRITSNVLGRSSELQPVQNLIRKAFVRIRYILDECATRNWKKFDEASLSATPVAAQPPQPAAASQ